MVPLLKAADSSEAVLKMSDDSCGLLGTTIVEVGQQVHNVDLEIHGNTQLQPRYTIRFERGGYYLSSDLLKKDFRWKLGSRHLWMLMGSEEQHHEWRISISTLPLGTNSQTNVQVLCVIRWFTDD